MSSGNNSQVVINNLAPLEVLVVPMDNAELCLGDSWQELVLDNFLVLPVTSVDVFVLLV